tara:strand:+ start:24851 stop:25120 length:270 start_codon:yes stop_codon:yes gene_type:complete
MIAVSPLHYVGEADSFRWVEGDIDGPFSMVVLTEDFLPVARFDGIEHSPWRPEGPLAELLQPGVRYHAYLLATQFGREVKSPLTTVDWQ